MRNASLRLLVLAGIVLLAVAALTGANRANATVQRVATVAQIDDLRQTTWRWQRLMRVPRTPTGYVERRTADPVSRSRLLDLWRMRAHHAELEPIVDRILAANPGQVEAYRGGKQGLLGFFVGQVMKETNGAANPRVVSDLLRSKLDGG